MISKYFRQRIKEAREQQLPELDLSYESYIGEKLTKIPACIFEYTHLKKLNLRYNDIEEIPSEIAKLTNLESLDLIGNEKLTSFPDELIELSTRISLRLTWNVNSILPEWFREVKQLGLEIIEPDQSSYKNRIRIATIPDEILNLENLVLLKIWLRYSNDWVRRLERLKELELDLSYSQLKDLPESVGDLTNLIELNLSENLLDNLPEFMGNLTKLTRLDLRFNQLKTLPEFMGNLTKLTRLDLSFNQLKTLPESMENLTDLIELNLSTNQLKYLPESVENLTELTRLDLSFNQLKTLPEFMENLTELTRLDLISNQLKTLPESMENLTELTRLDLRNNELDNIPKFVENIINLTKLDLRNNRINKLPDFIGNLTNLTELDLRDNPLEKPPIEVAEQGIDAIRAYFRQLEEEGKDYIYEAKLLIVGEGGAGKTTLAKKIEDSNYELDSKEKSTEGIDIIKWSFPFDNEREFKVNIWDFGGQEIYHATHQFFLTKRSLYVLVVDTRREDTDFYYWLNVVELLSNNSPLLIVKNEKDNRHIEIDINTLRGRFSNLSESLATNLKDNRGLNAILKSIQYHITELPHVGTALPKTWKRVRETLEEDKRNYISLQEYLNICSKNGFKQLKDKLQLSGYLHDLGVYLHFQDSTLLKNTVILKPEWGTDAVYKVLDDKQVINNLGRFTTHNLDNIWSDEQYLFKQAELLELMINFKLCYKIPGSNDTYIAPQLLTIKKPEYNWEKNDNLILRYIYEFIPKGIITQFIVAMHEYIQQQKYVWRSGVILEKEDTQAEIIEDYNKREIKIRLTGQFKRKLMTEIIYELDKINNSYHHLKYQKLIPCNCPTCINNQTPHGYDFTNLLERISSQKYTVECNNKPYHEVQILSLIDKSLDIQQLISQAQQDSDRGINIQGDGQQVILQLSKQASISGDIMTSDRSIKIDQGNYNEDIKGDQIDKSRTQNISDSRIDNSGAGASSLGDISGTVANTINELPLFENEPEKQELKELLNQLQTAVLETELDSEEKEESLEQIKAIASSLTNSQDGAMKKVAKRAMKMLRGTAAALPPGAALVTICDKLPELVSKIF